MSTLDDIVTARLALRLLKPAALEATVAGDMAELTRLLGCDVSAGWLEETQKLAMMRLDQLKQDPDYLPWSLRAVILRDTVIGYVNFHAGPGPVSCHDDARNAVELGYTIFEPFRRRGFADEALTALLRWARLKGADHAVLSISPDNEPSLRLARKFGFLKVGSQIDEEDGPEDVYLLKL